MRLDTPSESGTCETVAKAEQASERTNYVARAYTYFSLILFITAALAIGGVISMLQMPSGVYPEVAFPRIVVLAQTPGLAVKEVEVTVTRPIEDTVSIVIGVNHVRSKTVRGAAEISIDFEPGTNMVQALNDLRARMAEIEARLPADTTVITERQTPSVFPIISFVVTGGDNSAALYDYAFYDLRPRISRIPDVSYVTVQGGDIDEIAVEVEPQLLVATGFSISDVADRIAKEHRLKAVGRIDRDTLQYQVMTDSVSKTPPEIENIVIGEKNGQLIRVSDVARVVISHADRSMAVRANGRDAVALTVFRRLGGNTLSISNSLTSVLREAANSAPRGVEILPIHDQASLVRSSIANVRDAIIIGAIFSVIILLAFLKSVRATLIASLSIPLSLVITFAFLSPLGDTLNLMSLGGLAVAIGLIIDDTVVVIENISRRLAGGETGDQAVDQASREISGAVIGSTLTSILVFVPLAFVRGVIGQFFQSLSLALGVALLVSMVVSLTIIPVLAARFLTNKEMPSSGWIYNRLADMYERALSLGLRFPKLTLLAALLAVLPGWWLFQHVRTGFMPNMDEGAFILDYEMPAGTSLSQTDLVVRRAEACLVRCPDISGYIRRTGAENGLFATESYRGDILVSLKPSGQRRAMSEIRDSLREDLDAQVPELAVEFVPLIQDQINDLAGVDRPIEVKVFGPEVAQLRKLAVQVAKIVESVPGAAEVNANVRLGNPDIVVRPDPIETARVGLTVQDVEGQLNAALYGQIAGSFADKDRSTNIRVRYPDNVRFNRAQLAELPISIPGASRAGLTSQDTNQTQSGSKDGGRTPVVPLGQIASIATVRSSNELWRENQQPVITVTAELENRDLGSVNNELQTKLASLKMPNGYRWELAGNYRSQKESFASLRSVLIVSAVLVFLTLGIQFRSLRLPILVFLAQPLSLTSALFALWITGVPLNVSSFMGAILLIGLDVKNGIILVDYIGKLRAEGQTLHDALVHAGRARFRPILMTSLTAICALLPLAFGFGPGAQMQQPLAIAVIGGLTANMLFTRLFIPVGYQLFGMDRSARNVAEVVASETGRPQLAT